MRVLLGLLTFLMSLVLSSGTLSYLMAGQFTGLFAKMILLLTGLFIGIIMSSLMPGVFAQECAIGTAQFIKGNWYCSAVDSVSYRNFPGSGHYNRVVHMDTNTGQCIMEKFVYSGSLSPLNEEVSPHIRLKASQK